MKTEAEILKEILSREFDDVGEQELMQFSPIDVDSDIKNREKDLSDDYAETRRVLHNQIQMMNEASKQALINCLNADSPRMMEVFSGLMDTMTKTSERLLKVHKEIKDIEGISVAPESNVQNVFVGTSAELIDLLGTSQDKYEENYIDVKHKDITGEE